MKPTRIQFNVALYYGLISLILLAHNASFAFTTPSVISISPADNAINVVPGDWVSITFDRNVVKGTGDIILRRTADNSIAWSTPVTSPVDVKINGTAVEILLPFSGNGAYFVEIPATAFHDGSNDFFPGFSTASAWNFSTVNDNVAPAIVTQSPQHLATSIASNAMLSLTFNEPIRTVSGHILIKEVADETTIVSIDVSNFSTHLQIGASSITVSAPLKPNTSYYVIIPGSAISDNYGNYFSGFSTSSGWNFTTSSVQNALPVVTSQTPPHNCACLAPGNYVYMTFDRDVFKGSGDILLRKVSDNSIAWTTPMTSPVDVRVNGASVEILLPFEGNNAYYVEIPNTAFKDAANNYFIGYSNISQWSFTTLSDHAAPTVVSQAPLNQATGIATNTLLKLNFNEPIEMRSDNILIKQTTDNATVISIDVSNFSTHLQKETSSITISAPLEANTSYYVIVPPEAIADLYNNYFSGFTTPSEWNFTTLGTQSPVPSIIAQTPADNENNVVPTDYVNVSFDRDIFKGSGDIHLRKISDKSIAWTTPMTSPVDVRISGSSVQLLLPMQPNELYYIEIPGTAFKDADNNYFPGTTTQTSWNFATIFDVPSITSFSPEGVVAGGTVTLTGTNLYYSSTVTFGGMEAASFILNSPTSISAVVATGVSGDVSVTTPGGTASVAGFVVFDVPSVTSFSPEAVSAGETVTLTGTNLDYVSTVSFGGTPAASFTINSPTSISAVVAMAVSGDVSVTSPAGTASRAGFTFLNPVTGIEKIDQSQINVFPNPSNGKVIFIGLDFPNAVSTKLVSLTGRVISSADRDPTDLVEWEIANQRIPDGVYLLHILIGHQKIIRKIVIHN